MSFKTLSLLALSLASLLFPSCTTSSAYSVGGGSGGTLLGRHPSPEQRRAEIASEARGNFYYGRRYYVEKTRFWGYLRKPGQSALRSKLVVFNESRKRNPDRLPEDGPSHARYGYDQNYEYRIYGNYTGKMIYEPNSNQFLPEFMLTRYEVVNKDPGWLFRPSDRHQPNAITVKP